jgi:hypothetical protein
MPDYLRPKKGTKADLGKRQMEEGIFRNPPQYTHWGGLAGESKWTKPRGKTYDIGSPALERGGPSSQKGKPI